MSCENSARLDLLQRVQWRKSSYSGGNDDCVEIATTATRVAVRDSKNPGLPAALAPHAAWDVFITAITEGKIR